MKKTLFLMVWLVIACNSQKSDYRKAEDALDAGREFINSRLQGDFLKAAFYLLPDEKNTAILARMESEYREKDKEGRQQWRTASININEVKEQSSTETFIYFQNSFDKKADTICVIKQNDNWLVDLTKKQ
jgi:hypothetical protein